MPKTIKGNRLEIESQAPIINELERCAVWAYRTFGGDRTGVPPVTISIQTRGKKHTLCGRFTPDGFRTKEGEPVHEIIITAERLFEDPYNVLETVIHETVHLYNHDIGEKDGSKGGRHNKQFAETAMVFGLEVAEPTDSKGHAYTSLSASLRASLEKDFIPDLTVFRIFKEQAPFKVSGTRVKKQRPWVCQCPVTLQVATGVSLQAVCNDCCTEFILKEGNA